MPGLSRPRRASLPLTGCFRSQRREMRAPGSSSSGSRSLAALVTHSHPDHYAGLGEIVAGADVPIYAPQGVVTIAADDALKDQIIGPHVRTRLARRRVFPNTPIRDGESVTFDGVQFTVVDLGPSESPHDSPWILGTDERIVFLGDQIYGQALLPR